MSWEETVDQRIKAAKAMANADRHYSKRERESRFLVKRSEDYQVIDEVFDVPTLMVINDMIDSGLIQTVKSHFAAGKESKVYLAKTQDGSLIALKVYLTVSAEFKKRMQYISGDPRFDNVKKGSTRNLISIWAKKEFHNLHIASKNNIEVPKPLAVRKNVLAMEFIGDAEGNPAPKLGDCEVVQEDYEQVIRSLKNLYKEAKLVHADLSEYNIFRLSEGKIVLFDFGSAVTTAHPLSRQFLARDVVNINKFFEKRDLEIIAENELLRDIIGG